MTHQFFFLLQSLVFHLHSNTHMTETKYTMTKGFDKTLLYKKTKTKPDKTLRKKYCELLFNEFSILIKLHS